MNEILLYLLKVSGGLAIIAIPYMLLLRNDPNLVIKRIYLLVGILAAWIIPVLSFRRPGLISDIAPLFFIDPVAGSSGITEARVLHNAAVEQPVSLFQILVLVYLAGLSLMFLRNLAILIRWNRAWKKADRAGGVAYTSTNQTFTLFNRIFIPGSFRDHSDLETLLLHEKAHLRQMHFIDLTIMELTLLLTWFNPFSWLISRMIKENHEHLADRKVLMSGVSPARYRAQLLNQTLGIPVFRLGNPFNHSITFKRFNMMKKPLKSTAGIVKFLILIPAVLAFLALTTGTAQVREHVQGKVLFSDTGEPAHGASIVVAGGTLGTVAGPDGTFSLDVEGKPELVISFVGYKNLRIKSSDIGKKPILLEQGVFELDPGEMTELKVTGSVWFRPDGSEGDPVFVLDGKMVTEIEHLDPGNIESVEVIKDPNLDIARKYGARNGVILITTKAGVSRPQPEPVINSGGEEEVFFIVEEMPMFPGGKEALARSIYSRLDYPESASRKQLEGEVIVQFTVTASGELEGIQAVSSTDPVFTEPALKVFRDMPDWNPGKQRSKPVKTRVVVPVRFRLDSK